MREKLRKILSNADYTLTADFVAVCAILMFVAVWAYRQYLTSPPYIDHDRYPIRGIDISAHNGIINFDGVVQDSIEFVFIKATEGAAYCDTNFRLNYDRARKAGLKVGAYHFFRFDDDGTAQAVHLLRTIGQRELDLGVAVDVEQHGNPDGIPLDTIKSRLQDMIEYLNLRGYRVLLYANSQGYYDYLMPEADGMPLWICSFYSDPFTRDFTFWQYSHSGKVKGAPGNTDLNVFGGSREDWRQYLRDTRTVPRPAAGSRTDLDES